MKLTGSKVSIRVIEKEDMEAIQELWGSEDTMLASGGAYNVKTEDLDKLFQILRKEDDSVNNHYVIETKGKLVGDFSIRNYQESAKVAQIDLKIDHTKRNNGYAKEALALYLDYFFNTIKGNEIVFELWLVNYFAQHKLKEYGFVPTFVMEDSNIMSLTKENYLNCSLKH